MGALQTRLGRIGVEQRGEGGTPLLFLHGVGSDRTAWMPQLDRFGSERLTIAIDYPGYGDSGEIADATHDTFADAAFAVLDALEVERAHVCGLSLGGIVALSMAAAQPERLASLTLADTFARHPEGEAIYQRSLAGLDQLGIRGLAESRADALLAQPAEPSIRSDVIATMARIAPDAYRLAAAAVWLADQRKAAAKVQCPTLILCGSEDRITPPALSEELKDSIPHASLIEIAGAGHLPNLEQPDIFNRVLSAFIDGVEG